ncbi:MAG: sodium:solute symporter family protein [Waddliaceae bacterium]|jgi:solute:Na+ symporter, SSS family|nr:sodium:solute symporter family protein [Waddliaceae bacterium]MBT7264618.1 sodium:solute symporter family protein [Waddliaceae bacterium]
MNTFVFLSLFLALGIIYLIIGFIASKRIKDNNDYFLAGRKLGFWPLSLTLIATQLGGGVILGTCEESYSSGLYGIFYTLGICLGFWVLACGFAGKLRGFNVCTISELLEKKYRSTFLRKIASILSVMSLGGILIGLVVASRKFMLGIGIDNEWILAIFWLSLIAYTVIGGLKAVVMTDTLQVGVILAVFTCVLAYVFFSNPEYLLSTKAMRASTPSGGASSYLSLLLMPMLFSLVEQDLAQRFFSAKSKKTAIMASACAGLLLLLFSIVPITIGILAKNADIVIPDGSSVLMVTISFLTNDIVTAFVSCAVLAAIISTADSLLCAMSSLIAQDFNFPFLKNMTKLTFSKLVTFILGIVIIGMGAFFDDILKIYIQSYSLPVCALFAPMIFCFFTDRLSKTAAFMAVFSGLSAFVVLSLYPIGFSTEILAVAVSFIGYALGMSYDKIKE